MEIYIHAEKRDKEQPTSKGKNMEVNGQASFSLDEEADGSLSLTIRADREWSLEQGTRGGSVRIDRMGEVVLGHDELRQLSLILQDKLFSKN